jgi:hypothetical protein
LTSNMSIRNALTGAGILFLLVVSCDENVNPPDVEDQEFSVDENSPEGTLVGAVIAFDPDPGQSVTFGIRDGFDEDIFTIDEEGFISVVDPTQLDYETATEFQLPIVVTDDHPKEPMESLATMTILVNDLNEFAPVMEDQTFEINEGAAKDDLVGTILASDPESHQALVFAITSGNENQAVSLDPATGELFVNDPAAFDFDVNQQLVLNVLVRDVHIDSKTDTAVITILIKEV